MDGALAGEGQTKPAATTEEAAQGDQVKERDMTEARVGSQGARCGGGKWQPSHPLLLGLGSRLSRHGSVDPFLNFVRALRASLHTSPRGLALAALKLRAARLWNLMGEDERQPYVSQAERARDDREDQRERLKASGNPRRRGAAGEAAEGRPRPRRRAKQWTPATHPPRGATKTGR